MGVTTSPCREPDAPPIIRKNIFWGGGPNSPVSITKVPSSGVIILVVEEHKFNPALPAVALHNPRWGDWRESAMDCFGGAIRGSRAQAGAPLVVSLDHSKWAAIYISFGSAMLCPVVASLTIRAEARRHGSLCNLACAWCGGRLAWSGGQAFTGIMSQESTSETHSLLRLASSTSFLEDHSDGQVNRF